MLHRFNSDMCVTLVVKNKCCEDFVKKKISYVHTPIELILKKLVMFVSYFFVVMVVLFMFMHVMFVFNSILGFVFQI